MNDERLGKEIGEFYRETDVTPPDSKESARQVASRLPQAPQVKRHRWLPSWLRRQPAGDTPDDPTPEVTGRTRTMLNPVTAITAGALVFAIGGAFLIAQPFEQPSSGPGAELEAVAPTWVTGTVSYAPDCSGPETEQDGPVLRERNFVCEPMTWRASDPRLSGEVTAIFNSDTYELDDGAASVNVSIAYLRNEDGGWACSGTDLETGDTVPSSNVADPTVTCVGQDGYEGLSAVVVIDDDGMLGFEGLIFSGDLPPVAEPPAVE